MKFTALLLSSALGMAMAACPNSCSGRGSCDTNDQCDCYLEGKVLNAAGNVDAEDTLQAQFTGADCSLMTCPRGISFTTAASSTFHESSVECSDAGVCDRATGMCVCYEGHEGSACQRTTCPNDCSGHGVCQDNTDFAEDYARAMSVQINTKRYTPRCEVGVAVDETNCPRQIEHLDDYYSTYMVTYEGAWDSTLQTGCLCDSGYYGADCSKRECPTNSDPLDTSCTTEIADGTSVNIKASLAELNPPFEYGDNFHSGTATTTLLTTHAQAYTELYGSSSVWNSVLDFKTVFNHYTDLARACTSFYIQQQNKANQYATAVDPTSTFDIATELATLYTDTTNDVDTATQVVYPMNIDSWVCDYMWDSAAVKVPYCGGQWAGQECSGRGLCDSSTGNCACFSGYTGNDCSEIEQLS